MSAAEPAPEVQGADANGSCTLRCQDVLLLNSSNIWALQRWNPQPCITKTHLYWNVVGVLCVVCGASRAPPVTTSTC